MSEKNRTSAGLDKGQQARFPHALPIRRAIALLLPMTVAAALPGCIGSPANPAATQPTTAIDPRTAEAAYWYEQPATAAVEAPDYDALWRACRQAARDTGFTVDLLDYRDGRMTTLPLVSKQIFEPWKQDVVSWRAMAESTLSTMRRTVHFEIRRVGGPDDAEEDAAGPAEAGERTPPTTAPGSPGAARSAVVYRCVPKVVVERYSVSEHRITSETEYRDIFSLTRREATHQRDFDRDPTSGIPVVYWYAVGRDHDLERALADRIRKRVSAGRPPAPPQVAAE